MDDAQDHVVGMFRALALPGIVGGGGSAGRLVIEDEKGVTVHVFELADVDATIDFDDQGKTRSNEPGPDLIWLFL